MVQLTHLRLRALKRAAHAVENDLNGKIRSAIIGEQSCRKKSFLVTPDGGIFWKAVLIRIGNRLRELDVET